MDIFNTLANAFNPSGEEFKELHPCKFCGILHDRSLDFCSPECEDEYEMEQKEREMEKADILEQLNKEYEN